MSFDPDIIDAMVAAGMSAPMIAAVYRAYCAKRRRETHETHETHETVSETHETRFNVSPQAPARAAKVSTSRVQAFRARQKLKRETFSTGVSPVSSPSLSLIENIDSLRERGDETHETRRNAVSPVSSSSAIPLPPDWQPNEKGAQLAAGLGDIGATNCIANFRDHFEGSGKARTPAQWQKRFQRWVREDLARASSGQSSLPLMRSIRGTRNDPAHLWKFEQSYQETLARRRESG
jgi:hypothetical protein